MRRFLLPVLVATAVAVPMRASGPSFDLSVESIMRGPRLVGYPPSNLRWSGDSERLYFEWRERDADETSTWVVSRSCADGAAASDSDRPGCEPRKLTDEERKSAPAPTAVWDRPHRRALAVQDGDIVIIDTVTGTRTPVTHTTASESSPRWVAGDTAVTFVRDNSLFLLPIGQSAGGLEQLTDAGPPKRDPATTESQKFLKAEEQSLLEFVREAEAKRKKAEARREKEALPRIDLTERQSASDLQLAHDGRFVYALVVERPQNARRADVPNYVTASAYAEQIQARSKVGDAQDSRRLAIVNRSTKKTVWATLDPGGDVSSPPPTTDPRDEAPAGRPSGPMLAQAPPSASPAASSPAAKTDPARDLRWSMPVVSRDGKHAVATVLSADNEHRWFVLVDPESGKTRVLDHASDEAWLRGAGAFGGSGAGFLPDGRRLWFLSEKDGWMHLYVVDVTSPGATPTQLTNGRWEISSVEMTPDDTQFLIMSTEAHPGERHVYTMPLDGGSRTRLTTEPGSHSVELSPDGRTLASIFSTSNRPPEVFFAASKPGAARVRVTTSPSEEWLAYKWTEPKLVTYRARDGAEVFARLYTPEMVGAKRHSGKPAVIFVHGAGYLQNAHRYWSSYYREYMFHHLLASRGYVVLDPDYRASAGHGRDWRTAIYRHMGGKDLEDVVDGAKYLAANERVDPKRIGVYGGSYGGFITLMAMFTTPDVFAAGAALRPVTDWAHYNHQYTSSILNEPQSDVEAYRRSSPIYFAQNLRGALLICHGMVDVNVHFQDSVRLAQRLIELRKENWELAVYPVEDHAFEQETSWADEYKRILKLFETNLKR